MASFLSMVLVTYFENEAPELKCLSQWKRNVDFQIPVRPTKPQC